MDDQATIPRGVPAEAPPDLTLQAARHVAALLSAGDGAVERRVAERRAAGVEVINLTVVSPELPPPPEALEQLAAAVKAAPSVRGAGGLPDYRSAVARWYQSRFKTSLDPNREVLPLPSIEDGIVGLAQVLLNPDDNVLIPDPARPIYRAALALTGAQVIPLPLRPEQDFLPELKGVPPEVASTARMLWLDYPNLPTGAVAPASFFHQVLQFAAEYQILVVHVADYSEFSYDNYRTISLLEIPGARKVCVELHSPALTYNLPGWPGAFAVGNADALRLLRLYRQQLQYLTFVPAQRALAETMMLVGNDWLAQRNAVYQSRRDQATTVLAQLGLQVRKPKALPAIWAGVPAGYQSAEIVDLFLMEAGVLVTPGTAFGARGEGYVQLALTVEEARFQDAMRRLANVVIPLRNTQAENETSDHAESVLSVVAQGSEMEDRHAG